ncbi:MAG: ATP-binding cassette domain-containing protein, partial [Synechococcaceae cyanobacterium]|nr:ATP-binding cassette domain-containing protein [Synechococcaceae cyanobacterium]
MPRSSPPDPAAAGRADPMAALEVERLRVRQGRRSAVDGIGFRVERGEVFGLIGPDGAGKTSTFHVLGGVREPDGGRVRVLGRPPRRARERIGYLTQRFSLYPDLSVAENLRYVAGMRLVPAADLRRRRADLLERMDLAPFADRLAGRLSGGMRQKLALCCALIARPEVLLLDEPTTGVDPVSRREFWDVLADLSGEGVTIVVATPYLDEAERCHRIALLHEGRIRSVGSPAALRQGLGLVRLEVRCDRPAEAERLLERCRRGGGGSGADPGPSPIVDVQTFGDRLDVLVDDPVAGSAAVKRLLAGHGLDPGVPEATAPTLENVFVARLRQESPQPPLLPFPRPAGSEGGAGPIGPAIRARGLGRRFGRFEAVRELDLQLRHGEILGLLGANGAGKTTTIRMLCGLLRPTAGTVELAGEGGDLRSAERRRQIGYMSQKFTLYDDLTILQNLEFYAGVYGIAPALRRERIAWVLATCGLAGREDLGTGELPGGWKQRVAFGAAVLHDPRVLFLDEPTSGVDPLARRQFWQLINAFARSGAAVLVSTHYLEEAEQCNRLCLLVAGRKVIEGSPGEIRAAQPGTLIELTLPPGGSRRALQVLRRSVPPWRLSLFGDRLHLVLD